jgi:hypothetical protein
MSYFTYKEIMLKLRIINKNMIEFTQNNVNYIPVEKYVNIFMGKNINDLPPLAHPIVKFAEEV